MIHAQNEKLIFPQLSASAATNATASSDAIDTLGWHNAQLTWVGQKVSGSNISAVITTLKVQHATASDGTFSDFTGAALALTTNTTAAASEFTVATSSVTTLPVSVTFNMAGVLGTSGLSRFLRVLWQAPTGNNTCYVFGSLSRGDQSPNSAAEAGVWGRTQV